MFFIVVLVFQLWSRRILFCDKKRGSLARKMKIGKSRLRLCSLMFLASSFSANFSSSFLQIQDGQTSCKKSETTHNQLDMTIVIEVLAPLSFDKDKRNDFRQKWHGKREQLKSSFIPSIVKCQNSPVSLTIIMCKIDVLRQPWLLLFSSLGTLVSQNRSSWRICKTYGEFESLWSAVFIRRSWSWKKLMQLKMWSSESLRLSRFAFSFLALSSSYVLSW